MAARTTRLTSLTFAAIAAVSGMTLPTALGQAPSGGPREIRTGVPQRDTLLRLMRPITVDFQDKRLEDVIAFIKDFSGADIEPMWIDDQHSDGLDKDKVISVKITSGTVLTLIEKVLETARSDSGENTWQLSDSGALQIGPKDRLNRFRRVEIYDINDLLIEIPDNTEVPKIDLQQALQASGGRGGGGGGGGPFREEGGRTQDERQKDRDQRAQELISLLTSLVEPEQWVDNGGSGGTIRYYHNSIIVNAPDYMQRAINGYPYWPASATRSGVSQGRRYVTLTTDSSISKLLGFEKQPVTATTGGGGGGGSTSPGGGGR